MHENCPAWCLATVGDLQRQQGCREESKGYRVLWKLPTKASNFEPITVITGGSHSVRKTSSTRSPIRHSPHSIHSPNTATTRVMLCSLWLHGSGGLLIQPLECLWRGEVGADMLRTAKKTITCKEDGLRRDVDRPFQWKVGDTAGTVHKSKILYAWYFFQVKGPSLGYHSQLLPTPSVTGGLTIKDLGIHSLGPSSPSCSWDWTAHRKPVLLCSTPSFLQGWLSHSQVSQAVQYQLYQKWGNIFGLSYVLLLCLITLFVQNLGKDEGCC